MSYKTHVFVCTNAPDKPGKCGHKGGEELRQNLKKKCSEHFSKDEVRVNASGCLGYCEQGLAAVVYPQKEWRLNLKKEDVDVLFNLTQNLTK